MNSVDKHNSVFHINRIIITVRYSSVKFRHGHISSSVLCIMMGLKMSRHNDGGLDKGVTVSGNKKKKQLFSRFIVYNHCSFVILNVKLHIKYGENENIMSICVFKS